MSLYEHGVSICPALSHLISEQARGQGRGSKAPLWRLQACDNDCWITWRDPKLLDGRPGKKDITLVAIVSTGQEASVNV